MSSKTLPLINNQRSYGGLNTNVNNFTIDQALNYYGLGRYQYELIFKVGPIWMADSIELMLIGFLYEELTNEWDLNSVSTGLIGAIVFLGMFIGGFLWGILSDKKGRKLGYTSGIMMAFFFSILSALSDNIISFLVFRFMVGVGTASAHCGFNLIAEYIPSNARGKILYVAQVFYPTGTVIVTGLAWAVLPTLGWRWLLIFASLPCLIGVLMYFCLPESAYWYQVADKADKAKEELNMIAFKNNKEPITGELIYIERPLGKISNLFTPKYVHLTIACLIMNVTTCFAYDGAAIVTPVIFGTSGDGYLEVFLTSLGEIPGLLLPLLWINKIGRIKNLRYINLVGSIALILAGLSHNIAWLQVSFLFLGRMCGCGSLAGSWLYFSEVYPTIMRGAALGLASSVARLGSMIVAFVIAGVDTTIVCCILGSSMFIGFITTFFLKIETNLKALQNYELDDAELFQNNNINNDI